jgi:hypothetical protein
MTRIVLNGAIYYAGVFGPMWSCLALMQLCLSVVVCFGGSDSVGWRADNVQEPLACKFLRWVSRLVADWSYEVIIPTCHMA